MTAKKVTSRTQKTDKEVMELFRGLGFSNDQVNSIFCRMDEADEADEEKMIVQILDELGCPSHIKGYYYLIEAIKLYDGPIKCVGITKSIYPRIAKENGTTTGSVERAIRHAIEMMWDRIDPEVNKNYFENTIDYYNNKRIKGKLKGMSPVNYRIHSLLVA